VGFLHGEKAAPAVSEEKEIPVITAITQDHSKVLNTIVHLLDEYITSNHELQTDLTLPSINEAAELLSAA